MHTASSGVVLPHNRNCDFELQYLIAAVSSCHLCIRDPKYKINQRMVEDGAAKKSGTRVLEGN